MYGLYLRLFLVDKSCWDVLCVYLSLWCLKPGVYMCCNILELWTPLICNVQELRKMTMWGSIVLEI